VNPNQISIGRFRLALPEGYELSSREQSIYATKVWTVEKLDPAWAAALPNRISTPTLLPGVEAVWYENQSVRLLEAARPYPGHAFRLLRDAPAGKEPQAEKLATNILNAYAPSAESGFAVGHGAIRLGPAQLETTKLNLRAKDTPDQKISFSTQTVAHPDTAQYMDTKEEADVMRMMGGRLEVFTERKRTLAGLEGVEIQLLMAPPNAPPMVRYTWHFPGVPGDGTQPKINFVAHTTPDRRAALDAPWEAVLASLAKIPPGGKP